MRERATRKLALLLCAAFLLLVALSMGLGLVHAGHHCTGSSCQVCIAYWGAQFALRVAGVAAILRALRLIRPGAPAGRISSRAAVPAALSPVALGVRMNN